MEFWIGFGHQGGVRNGIWKAMMATMEGTGLDSGPVLDDCASNIMIPGAWCIQTLTQHQSSTTWGGTSCASNTEHPCIECYVLPGILESLTLTPVWIPSADPSYFGCIP